MTERMLALGFIFVSFGALSGCGVPSTSLTVENKSNAPLTQVIVSLAREQSRTSRIIPGQFVNFAKSSSSSGGMCVRFTREGRRQTYGFQYLIGPVPAFCRMVVHNQTVGIQCSELGSSSKRTIEPMAADEYNCRDIAD